MSNSTKILQLYFKPEQKDLLDPAFTPYDNTNNPRPELREWYIWDKEYENLCGQDPEHWGFVSWKFKEKTGLSGQQVLDHIKSNPGYDVYLFNPCIINEAVFANSWEQGDMHHPDISLIGNKFLHKVGYTDYDVQEVLLDRTRTVFANYVIGNRKFWDGFMDLSRKLFVEAKTDSLFNDEVFGAGRSRYAHDASLPNFTFLIERLLPTYLDINELEVCPYQYSQETVLAKYHPYFNEISALSDLKVLINRHDSDELFRIWNYFRRKFIANNPGVLGLE